MDLTILSGIIGSIILVIGAALPPIKVSHPAKLPKNWFFAAGNVSMFSYSYLNYLAGGSIFFVFLQILIAVSTVLMMLDTDDKIDAPILGIAGAGLVIWSFTLFEGYMTVVFVAGLVTLGVGFAMNIGTIRRNLALAIGSAVIAVFSYIMGDWVFFFLNVFFTAFSIYHVYKLIQSKE